METKKCTTCGKIKELDEFHKHILGKYGVSSECGICFNKRSKEYRRTKKGLVTRMYGSQVYISKKRGYTIPTHTKKELKDWLFSQKKFHELYDSWKNSGYLTDLSPSCDRIDDYKGYSLSNIQLMTWEENNNKHYEDRKNGINNKRNKAVISIHKITMEEEYYYSISQAERETNTFNQDISKCCLGKRKSAGGYYWKFKI